MSLQDVLTQLLPTPPFFFKWLEPTDLFQERPAGGVLHQPLQDVLTQLQVTQTTADQSLIIDNH